MDVGLDEAGNNQLTLSFTFANVRNATGCNTTIASNCMLLQCCYVYPIPQQIERLTLVFIIRVCRKLMAKL